MEHLDVALQPIVSVHTGRIYGVEALLRNVGAAGFSSIPQVFDTAFGDRCLQQVDQALRRMAIAKYVESGIHRYAKLFHNVDNRLLDTDELDVDDARRALDDAGLPCSSLCLEVSARHELWDAETAVRILAHSQVLDFHLAIDDFGSGYSGLNLLYHLNPSILKIDRFFIGTIDEDQRKKLFVTQLVHLAHTIGIWVVAEGVETRHEYLTCREIGCDLVQGYFVQHPEIDGSKLQVTYEHVAEAVEGERRRTSRGGPTIRDHMQYIEPLSIDTPVLEVLKRFRTEVETRFIPVVNTAGEPAGVIREQDLKMYVYSPYGVSLLLNRTSGQQLRAIVRTAPKAELHARLEELLEAYASEDGADAVVITENGAYCGVLDSRALLQVLNQREILAARDQNPLTHLPGNSKIEEYVTSRLHQSTGPHAFVYFDFDNFKPFNDAFGFRRGDRVIMLFADLLKTFRLHSHVFVGHIGGDDFFMGVETPDEKWPALVDDVRDLVRRFAEDVLTFYDEEDRTRGFIHGHDRSGRRRRFPLLTVSAAIVRVASGDERHNIETLSRTIADLKSEAKDSKDHVAVGMLDSR
jgi:diguanylate cyclase (GGDEF)-like protein